MFSINKQKGDWGEEIAAKYLAKIGYKIIERNYRNRFGEIDIVAREKEVICFVEVKMRGSVNCGTSLEAVDNRKQEKIRLIAGEYLQKFADKDFPVRFDVIAITEVNNSDYAIDFIKDAF